MNDRGVGASAVLGLLLAAGLATGGWLVGRAIHDLRAAGRYVTVKGFAEREVPANLAVWPIVFSATGNDLAAVQASLDASAKKVADFLAARGFPAEEQSVSSPRITDFFAQGGRGIDRPAERYAAEATFTLRSTRVDAVNQAIEQSGELVRQGVAVVRSYEYRTTYFYTALEQIKPQMIADATRDARRAAEQFAADSGSKVGAIRSAQQGLFSIEDRDPFSPEWKKVRVVTTMQYLLD
jgi:hypothetical protein